jgi:predicted site-specific integrase-resolvase
MKKLLKPADVADRFCLSVRTLANWRSRGEGPKFIKINGRVRYSQEDVDAYEKKARR